VRDEMRISARNALGVYEELAEAEDEFDYPGLAAELARSVLPLGTYTEWYWTTDAHNLMHWLRLRLDGHAQKEIRAYAEVIYQIFKAWLPALADAFDTYVRAAVTFSAKELAALATTGLSASVLKPGDHGMSAGELSEFAAKLGRLMAASDSSKIGGGGVEEPHEPVDTVGVDLGAQGGAFGGDVDPGLGGFGLGVVAFLLGGERNGGGIRRRFLAAPWPASLGDRSRLRVLQQVQPLALGQVL
jgi:hypothetical protein